MSRSVPVLLFVAASVAGCATHPDVVATYQPGDKPVVTLAPRDATYALMPLNGTAPRAQVAVAGGLPIGFAREEDGRVFALANQKRIPLPDGPYSWQVASADSPAPAVQWFGQVRERAGATVDEAGKVVGVPVTAALVACMMPIFLLIGVPGGP